jgi:dTMP kinase
MTGCFISFEGGEGTGKSTQASLLADALRQRARTAHLTREPGGTSDAEHVRSLLLGPQHSWSLRSEALLFAAARANHVEQLIRPAIARGEWVICDRFVDSSRAYQAATGDIADDAIRALHDFGSQGLLPDRTILLDLPEAIALSRAEARDQNRPDRIGGRSIDYHRQVRANFRAIAQAEPQRVRLIDASGTVAEVHRRILTELTVLIDG